jgi:RHS repeat-associated protein
MICGRRDPELPRQHGPCSRASPAPFQLSRNSRQGHRAPRRLVPRAIERATRRTSPGKTTLRRRISRRAQDLDEETGLYYHGARYYACWLGRWTAADPAGMVDGPNLYLYTLGNPLSFVDPNGTDAEAPRLTQEQIARLKAHGPPARIPKGARVRWLDQAHKAGTYIKGGAPSKPGGDAAHPGSGPAAAPQKGPPGAPTPAPAGETAGAGKEKGLSEMLAALDEKLSLSSGATEGGSQFGVHGGGNPQAQSSPTKQGIFATLSLLAAAIDIASVGKALIGAGKALATKVGEKLSEKLGLKGIEEATERAITQGAKEAVEEAVESAGKATKSLSEQAAELVPQNANRNRVTLTSPGQRIDVDLAGRPHAGIPTPHTKVSSRNPQAPKQPAYDTKKADVRAATQQDIRTVRRYLERQNKR